MQHRIVFAVTVTFLMLHSLPQVNAQPEDKALKKAVLAICKKDTNRFFRILDDYIAHPRENSSLSTAYSLRSMIQDQKGSIDEAIKSLELALANYHGEEPIPSADESCNWFFDNYAPEYILSEYNLLRKIATLYQKKADFRQALLYLGKINNHNSPTFGCGNGAIMVNSSTAIQRAQCFLGISDTSSAIDQLVDYCLFNEGDISKELVTLLKKLLDSKYSKQQIEEEINRSVANVKVVSTSTGGSVEFIFFGRKIPYLYYSPEDFPRFIAGNKNLIFLKS